MYSCSTSPESLLSGGEEGGNIGLVRSDVPTIKSSEPVGTPANIGRCDSTKGPDVSVCSTLGPLETGGCIKEATP